MEPKAKKTYIILSLISIILGGVVVILAFVDFKNPVIVVVPAAIGVMLIITIMWVVFVKIRQKERSDPCGKICYSNRAIKVKTDYWRGIKSNFSKAKSGKYAQSIRDLFCTLFIRGLENA